MAHGRTPDRAGLLANPPPRLDDIPRLYGTSVPSDDIDEYAVRVGQYRFDGVQRIVEVEREQAELRGFVDVARGRRG